MSIGSERRGPFSNYAGCQNDVQTPINTNNDGVLFLNSQITRDDVKDGPTYTLILGEKYVDQYDLGWLSGSPATLRNTGSPLNEKPPGWPSGALPPWIHGFSDEYADEFPMNESAEGMGETGEAAAQPDKLSDVERQSPWSLLGGNPDQPLQVGGFGSSHINGCNFAFGDGSVRFLSDSIEQGVLQRLANRADGKIVDAQDL